MHEQKLNSTHQAGYSFLIICSMMYLCMMVISTALTNRYVGTDALYVLGGTFTAPIVFILNDIVAEIYGYKIARFIIFCGFAMQLLLCAIGHIVIYLTPYPSFFSDNTVYEKVLGNPLLHIIVSCFTAYAIANLVNAHLLTKWKLRFKGEKFWLRSIGSSVVSEILYSFIAVTMTQLGKAPLNHIMYMALISCSIKVLYSVIFAYPANLLTNYIKRTTGVDVYETPTTFSPFRFFRSKVSTLKAETMSD